MSIGVVLHEPEQPGNTGAIGRTCLCGGASLHLICPLGFRTDEKSLKRAGLDYWDRLDVTKYENFDAFKKAAGDGRIWFITTKARKTIAEADFRDGDFLMFGRESAGIPEEILVTDPEHCARIPMASGERSLNLANAVAVCLYEALRKTGYRGLEKYGDLHRLSWNIFPSFEWFEDKVRELAARLPEEFFDELNGGIVVEEQAKISDYAEDNDLFILGEYRHSYQMGRQVRLFYGSFMSVVPHDEKAFEEQMWKTLRHEFRHHLESLANLKDLEREDERFIIEHLKKREKGRGKAGWKE